MNYSFKSDVGRVRPENQDRVDVATKNGWILALLCDGMGGHYGGAMCSSLTIKFFKEYFLNDFPFNVLYNDKKAINKWFINSMGHIKQNLNDFAAKNPTYSDMGTTLTAALIYPSENHIYVFNIGDSRTYIYNGFLHQVTVDQNLKNEWIKNGEMSLTEANKAPGGNRLTSCLGPNKVMNPDGLVYNKNANAKYVVLTSDGLHDWVDKPLFERVLQSSHLSLEEKANTLVEYAIRNMSNDNVSVVIVEI